MWRRRIELTAAERAAVLEVVKHDPKPYLRERAAAVVKVADGAVAAQVAAHGLLTRHKPDTVYGWLDRFLEHGVAGLRIRPGRGRKPTLSPPAERRAGRAAGSRAP